jgi:hypothetical protein
MDPKNFGDAERYTSEIMAQVVDLVYNLLSLEFDEKISLALVVWERDNPTRAFGATTEPDCQVVKQALNRIAESPSWHSIKELKRRNQ